MLYLVTFCLILVTYLIVVILYRVLILLLQWPIQRCPPLKGIVYTINMSSCNTGSQEVLNVYWSARYMGSMWGGGTAGQSIEVCIHTLCCDAV